jgi:hypothetical protein
MALPRAACVCREGKSESVLEFFAGMDQSPYLEFGVRSTVPGFVRGGIFEVFYLDVFQLSIF